MTLVLTCAALAVAGCAHPAAGPPPAPKALSLPAQDAPPARSAPPPAGCASAAGWSCIQQQRFATAGAYINHHASGHGYLSVVFTDRQTGRAWRYGPTQHQGWTASTIKLAIATDLLRRQRAHQIALSAADRGDLAAMLHSSDNSATDRLWAKFGGAGMLARFRTQYGMAGLHFVPGFTRTTYWGFVKCTADDLAALLRYLFAQVNPDDRGYVVGALRGVAPNQQWGIWAAGPAQQPGNKDGWSFESDAYGKHWVTNTVGFAGPNERYLLSVMYQVDPSGTLAGGVHAVSDVVALLFGEPIPAPVTVPAPDG
ncbi:MAG: serine hydrolase [Pseudonocardiaceae bacterium]